ncbi:hypothetical protein I4U23_026586 [Adineta vaga]|nr:hypothetical protein I4U23_026586 [Adineta vaga]
MSESVRFSEIIRTVEAEQLTMRDPGRTFRPPEPIGTRRKAPLFCLIPSSSDQIPKEPKGKGPENGSSIPDRNFSELEPSHSGRSKSQYNFNLLKQNSQIERRCGVVWACRIYWFPMGCRICGSWSECFGFFPSVSEILRADMNGNQRIWSERFRPGILLPCNRRNVLDPASSAPDCDLIKSRWRITHKIGGGGFGQIYQAYDKVRQEFVAVKVESNSQPRQGIRMEVTVLRRIQNREHICELFSGGISTLYNYMIITLLGASLSELRRNLREQRFTLSTTLRISLQILDAIESVHSIGFLHRDIKPSNFAIGKTNIRQIFILDFGLARKYTDYDQHVRPARIEAGFRGTIRYASINAHNNRDLGRHDDLWSFFYMLMEFLLGSLPWSKMKDKETVGRLKETYDYTRFFTNLPDVFEKFLEHIHILSYEDKPNYESLRLSFISTIQKLGLHDNDPYDWEKSVEQDESDSLIQTEQKRNPIRSSTPNPTERIRPTELNSQSKNLKNNRQLPKSSSRTKFLHRRTDSNPNLLFQPCHIVTNTEQRNSFDFDRIKLDKTGTGDQQRFLHEKKISQSNHRSHDTLARCSVHDHGQATSNGLLTYISQQFSNAAAAPGVPSVLSQWSPQHGETLTDDDIIKGNKSTCSKIDERGVTLSGEQATPLKTSEQISSMSKVNKRFENTVNEECYPSHTSPRSIEQNIQVPFGTYTKNTRRNNNHNQRQTSPAFTLQRFNKKKI